MLLRLSTRKSFGQSETGAYAKFIEEAESARHLLIDSHTQVKAVRDRLSGQEVEVSRQEVERDAEEAISRLREARTVIRNAYKPASRIRVLGPQTLVGVTIDVVQELNAQMRVLSQALGATIQREESAGQRLREYADHASSFVEMFGSFTARAAHVTEGHELPARE